jgi:hypothetical protein
LIISFWHADCTQFNARLDPFVLQRRVVFGAIHSEGPAFWRRHFTPLWSLCIMRRFATIAVFCGLLAFPVASNGQTARIKAIKPDVVWNGVIETLNRINPPENLKTQVAPTTLVDGPRAYVIDNTVDFAKWWMLVKRPGSLPDVDFSRFSAVVMFTPAIELGIIQVEGQSRLDYRIGNKPSGGEAYTIAVFPRSAVNAVLGKNQ